MDSISSVFDQICKPVAGSANGASPCQPGATPQVKWQGSQELKARLINLQSRLAPNNPTIQQSINPGPVTAAVIPCFNEDRTIAVLVSQLRKYLELVVVVDDGSTDETALKAEQAGATVLRHDRNRGKGAALRTGLSHIHNLACEWAVTLDGDGQHDPADLPPLLQCAEQTGALLVIGNRMDNAKAMPWLRRQVNRWMSKTLSQYASRCLPDTQSGFRLIHLPTWEGLSVNAQRFEIESEMLMAFLATNHPVEFVPIRVIPAARKSRIHPVADTLRWWRWWWKARNSLVAERQWVVARHGVSATTPPRSLSTDFNTSRWNRKTSF